MDKKRSVGLTVIGAFDFIIGGCFFYGCINGAISEIRYNISATYPNPLFGILIWLCILLLIALVFFSAGLLIFKNNLKLRLFNLKVAVLGAIVTGLSALSILFVPVHHKEKHIELFWTCWFLYFLWVVIYLTRPKVKEQFK